MVTASDTDTSLSTVELGPLGIDRGGNLLVDRALRVKSPGSTVRVRGDHPALVPHLRAWARKRGHRVHVDSDGPVVVRGDAVDRRWSRAERAGRRGAVAEKASAQWGLAARGALVEAGGRPLVGFDLDRKDIVWSELAPKLYAQAAANQWDPAAIDWTAPSLPGEVEAAVVQVMTYLVENEQAALVVPARFVGRIHPQYREVIAFLATQIGDEARHAEVFSRRAALCGQPLGVSAVSGRRSLQTLLDEPDLASASFLLSVLGEGSFLFLLSFIERHAPDPVTARISHLALTDEARHVAFAMGHLGAHVGTSPTRREALRAAIERRHATLLDTGGLSPAVHDSLVLLAAGSWAPSAIQRGCDAVDALRAEMDEGRRRRLVRLGFSDRQAEELSALHTTNFM